MRLSAYVLQKALLHHYTRQKLFPAGVYADLPCVQEWALKHAVAIKKLAPLLLLKVFSWWIGFVVIHFKFFGCENPIYQHMISHIHLYGTHQL